MDNLILKSVFASNFGPFAERVDFTLEADKSKKEYSSNLFKTENGIFDKVAYIYGANGAGKSFFCKILRQIQSIITLSPLLASGNTKLIDSSPFNDLSESVPIFKFEKSYANKPTLLGLSIVIGKIAYTYEFTVKEGIILSERLQKKYRRTETILERTTASFSDIKLKSELLSFHSNLSVVKDNVLCLSMANFLNNPLATKLINAICNIPVLNMATMLRAGINITEEAFCDERLEKYISIIKKADPTMKELKVSFEEKKVERQKINFNDFENREIVMATAEIAVGSTHHVYDNGKIVDSVEMPFFQTESNGTIKLFTVLPHLYDILEEGGTLILDEIENGLHPNLVRELINLFYDEKTNPYHAQLICTTHGVDLIESDVRRDQVWLINKNEMGISSLDRISNIDIRRNANLKQKYLEGVFGKPPKNFFKHKM